MNCTLQQEFSPFKGGESEALKRLKQSLDDKVLCYFFKYIQLLYFVCNLLGCMLLFTLVESQSTNVYGFLSFLNEPFLILFVSYRMRLM